MRGTARLTALMGAAQQGRLQVVGQPAVRRTVLSGILVLVALVIVLPATSVGRASATDLAYRTHAHNRRHPMVPNALELQVFHLLNASRAAHGIGPLTFNSHLLAVARGHSMDMAIHHYCAHNTPSGIDPFQRMAAAGISFMAAAENIGMAEGIPAAQAVTSIHEGMMAESPNQLNHRANILNRDLHQVGVGVYTTPSGGTYLTEDFTN